MDPRIEPEARSSSPFFSLLSSLTFAHPSLATPRAPRDLEERAESGPPRVGESASTPLPESRTGDGGEHMSEEGTGIEIEVRDGAVAAVRIRPVPYTVVDLDTEGADPDRVERDGTGSAYVLDGGTTTVGGFVTDVAPAQRPGNRSRRPVVGRRGGSGSRRAPGRARRAAASGAGRGRRHRFVFPFPRGARGQRGEQPSPHAAREVT